MLTFIFNALIIASVSWFYHVVLKDYILESWFEYGYNNFGKEKFEGTWRMHLYMPVWGCQYCTSGQFALWSYLFIDGDYHLFYHIAFITLTVLITKIIWKYLEA